MHRPHPRSRIQRRSKHFAALALCLLPVFAIGAAGQIPEGVEGPFVPHPEAREAISRLYSPYCPGIMLETCPATESRILRDSIHALALQGWTAADLEAWMLANHGEGYRAVPQRRGSGLGAWLLPPLALLIGLGLVVVALRRFRPAPASEARTQFTDAEHSSIRDPVSAEDDARLRQAIRDMEWGEDPSF